MRRAARRSAFLITMSASGRTINVPVAGSHMNADRPFGPYRAMLAISTFFAAGSAGTNSRSGSFADVTLSIPRSDHHERLHRAVGRAAGLRDLPAYSSPGFA